MEETCVKTIKNFTDEEISQLIVDMQIKGWRVKKLGKEAIHFARLVAQLEYKQVYDD